ncbi:RNA 2'-phosphotransferase [Leifsonia sp. Leaf336]|uniref:RNA 2'-phosphotransferase n=1 Tax=Leifsonia sp. Leaf336 TaxID=1736341 RepID=UPI00138F426F|nr:RNA 2'-phosphotransferase [Leifsonia sp. Leaf336]
MAQDVESQGSVSGPLLPINQGLALAARNGDASPLFATAARFAVNSHELERRRLGGRGSVIVLQDAEDSIGQSFVFKRLSSSADLADRTRTESLFQQIEAHGARHQFGVVDHLTTIPATMPGVGGEPGDVVSVRRFRQGQTLEEAIHAVPSRAEALVGQAASFLAMFHSKGSSPGEGLRRCLWEKELGRWLRAMFSDEERAAVFQEWWELVRHAPVLDRRDAHALNWLVDTKGRILAVDMDAKGCRPFGYELAQLIEDIPWLAPSDWDARRRLLDRYVKSLNSYGWRHQIGFAEARELLAAGVLARALWLFSHPSASSETRMRAGQLIDAVAFEHGGTPVGRLASRLSARWVEIAGVGSGVQELVLTIPERRRISRAMAFHLRHDPLAPATKDGWVHVEELALLLTASGHRVTPETLLLIAGAAGEPRFERDSFDIRATYGHSVERAIPYESKTPPINLYHATPLGNLQSIFEARAGLNKGKRQWVHLSDSPATALNASNRQQKPVALLRVKARRVGGIVYASGTTWLAPHVQPDVLEVLTLQEVQDVLTVSDPI